MIIWLMMLWDINFIDDPKEDNSITYLELTTDMGVCSIPIDKTKIDEVDIDKLIEESCEEFRSRQSIQSGRLD